MTYLDERSFLSKVTTFLKSLGGADVRTISPDQELAARTGLDSLQLVALLRFIEGLRGRELDDIPEFGGLTLRNAYYRLYKGESTST